jgi:hypothetical protein
MNVGSLAMSSRQEGAAADARSGTFSAAGAGHGSLSKLLQTWMREEGSHGRKRNSLFVLSPTQLPPKQIESVKRDFKGEGYECQDTHGVPGALRRIEVAGVMVCIDNTQLCSPAGARGGGERRPQRQGRRRGRRRLTGTSASRAAADVY